MNGDTYWRDTVSPEALAVLDTGTTPELVGRPDVVVVGGGVVGLATPAICVPDDRLAVIDRLPGADNG